MSDGLCQCGCGGMAPISRDTDKRCGAIKGQPRRYIVGHAGRGKHRTFSDEAKKNIGIAQLKRFSNPKNHPRWKGGKSYAKGYVWIRVPGHPRANRNGYVKRCILAIEEIYGNLIPPGWDVHHNDCDKQNDDLLNLAIMPHDEHARLHLKTYMPKHYRRPRRG